MTGVGGDMFALFWSAKEKHLVALNASGRAGSLMSREELVKRGRTRMPSRGIETVTVPGALAGWDALLKKYGTITLAQAVQPAIEYAEKGFVVTPVIAGDWAGQQRILAAQSGSHDELPMIALDEVVAPCRWVDLLHLDIQGGEADFIAGCLSVMNSKVGYLVVGTHSRQIEGHIVTTLLDAGWTLEIERPAIITLSGDAPQVTVDGVQGWRNPRLDLA